MNLSMSSVLKWIDATDFGEIGGGSKSVSELPTATCRSSGTIGGGGRDPLRFIKYCDFARGIISICSASLEDMPQPVV